MAAGFDRHYQIAKASATKTCAPIVSPSSPRSTSRPAFDEDIIGITEGHDPQAVQCWIWSLVNSAHAVRRGHASLWLGQAGPAHPARAGGRCRSAQRGRVQVFSGRPTIRKVAWPPFVCRVPQACRAARSTTTPSSSASTAPRAWPISRSTRAKGVEAAAVADRQVHPGRQPRSILDRVGAVDGDIVLLWCRRRSSPRRWRAAQARP